MVLLTRASFTKSKTWKKSDWWILLWNVALFLVLHDTLYCKQWQADQSYFQSTLVGFLNWPLVAFSSPTIFCLLQKWPHLLSRMFHMQTLSVSSPFHLLCLSMQPLCHLMPLQFTIPPCLTTAVICMELHSNKNNKTMTPKSHLISGKAGLAGQRREERSKEKESKRDIFVKAGGDYRPW